jgi:hypothetical protein
MVKYFALRKVTKNLIFIDGINRTGKLLTGSLVSSFNKMEHLEFGEIFQHIIPALKLKKISTDFSKAYLHNHINQLLYNKYLSRNVNFRKHDRTGIANYQNPDLYKKRLNVKEGDKIMQKIINDKPFLPFVTHDIMCNYDQFLKLKIDIKIIEIFRNPVDLVYSWSKKNLSTRFGRDKRIFTLLIERNKKPYSQHLYNLPVNWHKLNDIEKNILYVKILTERSVKQLKKNYNKNIYLTDYETIVENTESELKKIAKFLNTSFSKKTHQFIKKENCPKSIDYSLKNKKTKFIKSKVSKKYLKVLIDMEKKYIKNIYGLKRI